MHKSLLFILLLPVCLSAQHGAFISPVIKYTQVNNQSAMMYGGKAGWIINKTFVIGGAFYGLLTKVSQPWIDPLSKSAPYIYFNTGGLNLEYFVFRREPLSVSLEMFLGGAGLKLLPRDETGPFVDLYGGDFLIFEPQLNASYSFNDWLHLSLGLSYRYADGFDIYPDNKLNDPSLPSISINSFKGTSAVLSLVFGMY